MEKKYSIHDLSSHLFWDTDSKALDFEKSKEQIIYKVIEYGIISDWKIIKAVYGLETIKNVSLNFRSLDEVSLAFLANIFQIDKNNFRCYKLKQSNQNFWSY